MPELRSRSQAPRRGDVDGRHWDAVKIRENIVAQSLHADGNRSVGPRPSRRSRSESHLEIIRMRY